MKNYFWKKLVSLSLVFTLAVTGMCCLAITEVQAAEIPSDAKSFKGHMYYVYDLDNSITWEKAKEKCEAVGGHLVSITSAKEQDFVSSLNYEITDGSYYSSAWIGGAYIDGKAKWVTGEKITYVAANSEVPSASYPLAMRGSSGEWLSTWAEKKCGYYICEWDTSTATILPEQVTGVKVKKIDSKSLTVSWKKTEGAKGYAVYMKTGKNGKYKKIKDITDKSVTSMYKGGLKKGKTYYFRVRAFKDIYGERSYGELSDEKKLKL